MTDRSVDRRHGNGPAVPPDVSVSHRYPQSIAPAAEAALFRSSFEEAAVGLAHVAFDGQWLRVNRALCTILGYSAEELLSQTFQDVTHPSDLAMDVAAVNDVLEGRRPSYAMRKRYLHRDGRAVWGKLTVSLIHDDQGNPLCFLSVVEDITNVVKAEEALRRSEEWHRRVLEDQTDLICRYSNDLILTYVNEPYAQLRGKTREALIGQHLLDGLPMEHHASIRANIASLSPANPTVSHENPWLLPDGALRWFHWTDRVIVDDDGTVLGYQGVGRDITERRALEAAERERQLLVEKEQIVAILDHSPNAKFLLDSRLQIQRTNQVVEKLFHYSVAECIHRSFLDLFIPDYSPHIWQATTMIAVGENVETVEAVALCRDGATFPAEISIGRTSNGFVCTLSDITERKQYEKTLRYHASLQEHVSDAVIAMDCNMCIQSWNHAAEVIYGWRAEEVLGRPIAEVIVTKETAQEHERNLALLHEQGWWLGEVMQRRRDGTLLRVLRSVTLLKDEQGAPDGFVTVNHDVTALYEAVEKEKELAKLRARMAGFERERELTDLKQRFVYMASHEFRTPLATIHSLAETLCAYRQRMNDSQIDNRLDKIRQQANYLAEMIEDVLQLATLEAKHAEFEPEFVDYPRFCRTAIAEFENTSNYEHRIHFSYAATDATVTIRPLQLDCKLMRQVLDNLLSNAVKYSSPTTTIWVSLEFTRDTATLIIRDEGIGISQADLKHIFTPFHRGQNVETVRGTGLGLTIVKEAVDLHGGTITVESELQRGTTFSIRLPRRIDIGSK